MKGRIPTYSIGERGTLPKTRVLIQEQKPTSGVKGCWISEGGHHIVAYGYDRDEILKAVLGGLGIERRGRQTLNGDRIYTDGKLRKRGWKKGVKRKRSLLSRIKNKINN